MAVKPSGRCPQSELRGLVRGEAVSAEVVQGLLDGSLRFPERFAVEVVVRGGVG
jgi:hypothetical protein